MSKKQNSISLSTAKAEYIIAGSCCTQLLWMQKLLLDYGIHQEHLIIYCDNTSAINISKNPIQHSRTTSLGSLLKMVLSLLSLFTLMIRRLTCLLNLLIVNALNSFVKTLVLFPWDGLPLFSSFSDRKSVV